MKLITSPASPYSRKVKALLFETGLMDEVALVPVKTTPLAVDPAVRAANPLGKIPCLLRPDGPALYDSRVICRYLDARAGGQLYPNAQIWDILTLEATADGILDSALSMVYELRFREADLQSSDWLDSQWEKVKGGLTALENVWLSHLNGPVTMGHLAVGCALGYLDFRHADKNWQSAHPELAKWFAAFEKRPALAKTMPTDH